MTRQQQLKVSGTSGCLALMALFVGMFEPSQQESGNLTFTTRMGLDVSQAPKIDYVRIEVNVKRVTFDTWTPETTVCATYPNQGEVCVPVRKLPDLMQVPR